MTKTQIFVSQVFMCLTLMIKLVCFFFPQEGSHLWQQKINHIPLLSLWLTWLAWENDCEMDCAPLWMAWQTMSAPSSVYRHCAWADNPIQNSSLCFFGWNLREFFFFIMQRKGLLEHRLEGNNGCGLGWINKARNGFSLPCVNSTPMLLNVEII